MASRTFCFALPDDIGSSFAITRRPVGRRTVLGETVLGQLGLGVDPVQHRLAPTDFCRYAFS
jgi:hypothetical protein